MAKPGLIIALTGLLVVFGSPAGGRAEDVRQLTVALAQRAVATYHPWMNLDNLVPVDLRVRQAGETVHTYVRMQRDSSRAGEGNPRYSAEVRASFVLQPRHKVLFDLDYVDNTWTCVAHRDYTARIMAEFNIELERLAHTDTGSLGPVTTYGMQGFAGANAMQGFWRAIGMQGCGRANGTQGSSGVNGAGAPGLFLNGGAAGGAAGWPQIVPGSLPCTDECSSAETYFEDETSPTSVDENEEPIGVPAEDPFPYPGREESPAASEVEHAIHFSGAPDKQADSLLFEQIEPYDFTHARYLAVPSP